MAPQQNTTMAVYTLYYHNPANCRNIIAILIASHLIF